MAYSAVAAAAALTFMAPPSAVADALNSAASRGGAFVLSGYGARAWGMGGAAMATVADESSIYWNPAMMSLVRGRVAGASYLQLVSGLAARQSQVAYVHSFARDDRDQRRRGISRHVAGFGYTNVFLDINGPESYSENHISAAYAYTPEDLVTFAVSARMFFSNSGVDGFGAFGTSVTGAMRIALSEDATLALVMPDLFSRFSYDNGRDESIQRSVVTSVALRSIPHTSVEAGTVIAHSDLTAIMAGAETDYLYDRLSLRAGMTRKRSGRERSIPYFGFGLRGIDARLAIHYSAGLDSDTAFGTTHRFSLSFSL